MTAGAASRRRFSATHLAELQIERAPQPAAAGEKWTEAVVRQAAPPVAEADAPSSEPTKEPTS